MSTFRKEYRELSEIEKTMIKSIKEKAEELEELLNMALNIDRVKRGRAIAIAKTHLEESIMWAVKGITE